MEDQTEKQIWMAYRGRMQGNLNNHKHNTGAPLEVSCTTSIRGLRDHLGSQP